jgi:hypothetical protein
VTVLVVTPILATPGSSSAAAGLPSGDAAARSEVALHREEERFQETIRRALESSGQAAVVEVLEGVLPLVDRPLQEAILESFAEFGTGPSLGALLRAAESPDPTLRFSAAKVIAGN